MTTAQRKMLIKKTVKAFAQKMLDKMLRKDDEGLRDWQDKNLKLKFFQKLNKNLRDRDYVDVANIAMILDGIDRKADK